MAISLRVSSEYSPMGVLYCLLAPSLGVCLAVGDSPRASSEPEEVFRAERLPFI